MARYREVSASVFDLFHGYTPLVEPLSIDEAFLDVTASRALFGDGVAIARELRARVAERTGCTCSVGVSAIKFVAKIASGHDKPDGLTAVPPGEEAAFLAPMPVEKLWGVGPKTLAQLRRRGVRRVDDLRRRSLAQLRDDLGEHGEKLWHLAHGRDARAVVPGRAAVQVSHEDTFEQDLTCREEVRASLLAQATAVADRLTRTGRRGRHISIKIRDAAFRTVTRQRTLDRPTAEASTIYETACALFDRLEWSTLEIRLTGVGVSGLSVAETVGEAAGEAAAQLELALEVPTGTASQVTDAADPRRRQAVQETLTAIRDRYGVRALTPAASRAAGRAAGGKAASRQRVDEEQD